MANLGKFSLRANSKITLKFLSQLLLSKCMRVKSLTEIP